MSSSAPAGGQNRRKEMDVMKLLLSEYNVELVNDSMVEFHVVLHGPADTPYEGGVWQVIVKLPDDYPYRSPSIGFSNRIYHPNIDESSGSVCLDVINQTWSPLFDMYSVFSVFLPQLLSYPNPSDPLNSSAADLLLSNPDRYNVKVKEYVRRYAQPHMISMTVTPSTAGKSRKGRHRNSTSSPSSSHSPSPSPSPLPDGSKSKGEGENADAEVDVKIKIEISSIGDQGSGSDSEDESDSECEDEDEEDFTEDFGLDEEEVNRSFA